MDLIVNGDSKAVVVKKKPFSLSSYESPVVTKIHLLQMAAEMILGGIILAVFFVYVLDVKLVFAPGSLALAPLGRILTEVIRWIFKGALKCFAILDNKFGD
ncbi:MAG: hypothetical protein HZB85_08175 [Deltaproteobacteria bacterium]|nr:hypothetical protein [Deltaproteobacteria bacterium]